MGGGGGGGGDVWSFSFAYTPSTCIFGLYHSPYTMSYLSSSSNTATGTATTTAPRRVRSLISYDVY